MSTQLIERHRLSTVDTHMISKFNRENLTRFVALKKKVFFCDKTRDNCLKLVQRRSSVFGHQEILDTFEIDIHHTRDTWQAKLEGTEVVVSENDLSYCIQ